jgi:translation elongation factor EF-Ts
MAEITAQSVKALRDKTGAGMMDCKNALVASDGDMEAAVDWLRAKGLSKAAKKADRVAAEGLIGVAVSDTAGALVEVNSETDFVARNEMFQTLVSDIARAALAAGGDVERLKAATYPGTDKSIGDHVTDMIGKVGENMVVRRAAHLAVGEGVVGSYVHNQVGPGWAASACWWGSNRPARPRCWRTSPASLPCMWPPPARWRSISRAFRPRSPSAKRPSWRRRTRASPRMCSRRSWRAA